MYFCKMNISRTITLTCITVGGAVALYAKAQEQQNQYILMAGIVLLMIGVYRLSRNIPSKNDEQEED